MLVVRRDLFADFNIAANDSNDISTSITEVTDTNSKSNTLPSDSRINY
jgi:hypothetical protein